MEKHKNIHIKVGNFKNYNPTRKKKIIFSGKYCKTFLFEDEEKFLKTRQLYKTIDIKKFNKKITDVIDSDLKSLNSCKKKRSLSNMTNHKFFDSVGAQKFNLADSNSSFKNSSYYYNKIHRKKISMDANDNLGLGISYLDKKYGVLTNLKNSLIRDSDLITERINNDKKHNIKNNRMFSKESEKFILKSFEKNDFYFNRK
jgi:hypothetical protein